MADLDKPPVVRERLPLPPRALGPEHDPLYRDAVLLTLYDRERLHVPMDEDFRRALWQLRGYGLVAWNEATSQPAAVLTGLGWDLAGKLARR